MLLQNLFSSTRSVQSQLDRSFGERLADPALAWRYLAKWPEIPGIEQPMIPNSWVIAESIAIPHPSIPATPRFSGGSMTYFPEFADIESINVSFYESQYYQALRYIMQWRSLILDSRGNYGLPRDFKKELSVLIFSSEDSRSPVIIGRVEGAWPSEVNAIEYSYENEDRIRLEVTFSVDSTSVDFLQLGAAERASLERARSDSRGFFDQIRSSANLVSGFVNTASGVIGPARQAVNTVNTVRNFLR